MGETPRSKSDVPLEDSIPQASLESILCTEELQRRPSRPPDYEKENRALVTLRSALADSPTTIFRTLAETILDITQCDSAGLSLLTRDGKTPDVSGERFYWPAIAGMWALHVGGETPRNFGPCGDVLDQKRTLLFRHFERRYPYLLPATPAAEECLLVPFYVAGEAVGTIWAIMHSDRRKFDAEDDRVMASLGEFASSAYQAWKHIEDLKLQVAEREKAETELRELTAGLEEQVRKRTAELQGSEELLTTFVKNVPAAVAMLDREMRYLQVSDRWCTDYLSGREQVVGRSHYEIFPDMPERWKEVHRCALSGETLRADEDRWDGQDGPHWARWEVRPWNTPEGTVGGILILAEDITRRKLMEEALSSLSRKLIEAQEQERTRIGRELHDDINQRLALLAAELQQLQDNPAEVGSRLQELRKQTAELSDDVQALSHELHSSKLEYLGVVSGIKSWCREFGERQAMEIDFKSDVPTVVPFDVGICLFRVLQEALHNSLKHSGDKRVEVRLTEHSNEFHLIVTDHGRGFDVEAASQGRGLGLTSMQERVRLANGTITIESRPMGGTTIHVRISIELGHKAQRAAG